MNWSQIASLRGRGAAHAACCAAALTTPDHAAAPAAGTQDVQTQRFYLYIFIYFSIAQADAKENFLFGSLG